MYPPAARAAEIAVQAAPGAEELRDANIVSLEDGRVRLGLPAGVGDAMVELQDAPKMLVRCGARPRLVERQVFTGIGA